jgi:hypothetical protein
MKKILDNNIEQGAVSVNKNKRIEMTSPLSIDDGVLS